MPEIISGPSSGRRGDSLPESLKGRFTPSEMGTRVNKPAPIIESHGPKQIENDELANLESFVYKNFPEVSVEVINSITDDLLVIFRNENFSDEQKKKESEQLFGRVLDTYEFDELKSLCVRVQPQDEDDDMKDLLESDEDNMPEIVDLQSSKDENESLFIALNDPIRFRNTIKVNPLDINAHWLENVLSETDISAKRVIDVLESSINEESGDDEELKKLFGLDNFSIYQLISENKAIIYWYTKLAWAETGDQRDDIQDIINAKGLSLEDINQADEIMEEVPHELNLKVVGIPLSGMRFMTAAGQTAQLPDGSTRFTTRNYEQYNVPASKSDSNSTDWPLVEISSLPEFAKSAFKGLNSLNVVQSKVCKTMVESNDNVLLSAPTGAGKTNVALLALTKCLNEGFKCVCIAPLKALVQEQVLTLQSKLPKFKVAELSGDQAQSRSQLETIDVIVSTPEKWDVVTRKSTNIELLRTIGLVVIDEIHLLHDETRGGVLENIVIRHKLQPYPPRLVGLSATLPNYGDIGEFLNAPSSAIFHFDASYRPVPLEQIYIGVTPKSAFKQLNAINEACIEKVMDIVVAQKKQALIFVQSRKETEKTRQLLLEAFADTPFGVGIHHAGLTREQRQDAETQFKDGAIRVLVSTATLAWGVNLPAAAVIIKGTEYYDPRASGWTQLSPQDVLQMLGRAGRPGFDTQGMGIIITSEKYLNYFASVAMMAVPIESFLVKRLCDSLNAEISSKSIHNIDDCVEWIKNSFWYIRFKSDPVMYGDTYTVADLAHSALSWLKKYNAIIYKFPDVVKPTFLGDISAKFYISPESAYVYSQELKPWLSDIDIIRVFSRSVEFSTLPVRKNETNEIVHLASLLPIPIRDALDTRFAKVSVLLQVYISRMEVSGLALSSDVVYVAQSASRLFRAIYELSVAVKWGNLARRAHDLYLMVDRRQWMVGQSPLRQFPSCPPEITTRMEASQVPWQRYFDFKEEDINRVLRLLDSRLAKTAYDYIQKFPRFSLNAYAQPVSKKWIWVSVDAEPLFNISEKAEPEIYSLIIESNRGAILHSSTLTLRSLSTSYHDVIPVKIDSVDDEYYQSPYLFVRLLSDKWLYFQCEVPVNLRAIKPPLNISDATDMIVEEDFEEEDTKLFNTDSSKLIQMLSPLLTSPHKSFYIGMFPNLTYYECIQVILDDAKLSNTNVLILSNDVGTLMDSLTVHDNVEILDIQNAEGASRKTSDISSFDSIGCIICESLHSIGTEYGYYYEALVTRLRIAFGNAVRFVGFGYPVSSSQSLGQWLGAKKSDTFNFGFDSFPELPEIDVLGCSDSLVVSLWDILPKLNSNGTNIIVVGSYMECLVVKEELELAGEKCSILASTDDEFPKESNVMVCTHYLLSQKVNVKAENLFIIKETFDLPISDLLALTLHGSQNVTIFTENQEYFASCINSPMPLESGAQEGFMDMIIPEIVKQNIKSPQDALNWLLSTFLFKRLRQNPSYYRCVDVQDWLSELVESTFEKLADVKAITILDEDTLDIKPEPLAHICVNRLVNIESIFNKKPVIVERRDSWLTHGKKNLLKLRGIDARIDIALAANSLSDVFDAFDQRQYLVQSLPLNSSPLRQIPHIDNEVSQRCNDAGISSMQDFIGIEDDDLRSTLLGFNNENPKMIEVADFVNNFPVVDIESIQLSDDKKTVIVNIERDIDPDDEISLHAAPGFPADQDENWYIIGANSQKHILFFDRIEIKDPESVVEYKIDDTTLLDEKLTVWLVCGSYIEVDKQLAIES